MFEADVIFTNIAKLVTFTAGDVKLGFFTSIVVAKLQFSRKALCPSPMFLTNVTNTATWG